MTQDQFKTWLEYHCAVVPAFSAWFTTLAARVNIKDTTDVWYEILKDSDFERCKQVSHDMGTGKIKSDIFFSEHPEFVRDRAKPMKQQRTISEQAAIDYANRYVSQPGEPSLWEQCLAELEKTKAKAPEPKNGNDNS